MRKLPPVQFFAFTHRSGVLVRGSHQHVSSEMSHGFLKGFFWTFKTVLRSEGGAQSRGVRNLHVVDVCVEDVGDDLKKRENLSRKLKSQKSHMRSIHVVCKVVARFYDSHT